MIKAIANYVIENRKMFSKFFRTWICLYIRIISDNEAR